MRSHPSPDSTRSHHDADHPVPDRRERDCACRSQVDARPLGAEESAVERSNQRRGLLWIVGAFAICPCHLPLTLWLVGSLFASTALGGAMGHHQTAIALFITFAWLLATLRGILLMRQRNPPVGRRSGRWFLLALCLASSGARAQRPASSTPEDSVRAAEYSRRQALLSADTVLLSRLTAAEFYEINRFAQI